MTGRVPAADARSLERLIFFSDAVFAIAITLLILEIAVPHLGAEATDAQYKRALIELIPSFFAYVLSFLVIGRFWMGHHELFGRVSRYSHRLLFPNLLFLMAIAFMPFATAFLGANLGRFVPALTYNLTLLITALLDWNVTRVAASAQVLSQQVARSDDQRSMLLIGATLLSIALTWWVPQFSQMGMLLVPIGFAAVARQDRRRTKVAA
jgi:uncharacterized membrane protein